MKCQNCGNEITDNQKFCSNCGKELNNVINKKLSQEELEQKIIEYKDNISQAVYLVQSNLNYDIANARKYVDTILIKNGISSNNKTTNIQSSNTDKFYIRTKKFFKYAGILAIILFVIAFIGDNFNSKKSTENTITDDILNKNTVSDSTIISCAKSAVSDTLKSSSTARWGTSRIIEHDNYGRYLVFVTLEATNSFGAYSKLSMLVIVYDVTSDGHYKINRLYGTQDITGYEKFVDTMDWSYIKEHNNWNVDPEEGIEIQTTEISNKTVILKKDLEGTYFLECDGEKIYSENKSTSSNRYSQKDVMTVAADSVYSEVLWWSGTGYTVKDGKLTPVRTLNSVN